jgi:hypothetical protein
VPHLNTTKTSPAYRAGNLMEFCKDNQAKKPNIPERATKIIYFLKKNLFLIQ